MAACLVLGALVYRLLNDRGVWLLFVLGLIIAASAGWGAAQWRSQSRAAPVLPSKSAVYKGEGTVLSVDKERGHRARYLIEPRRLSRLSVMQYPKRIRMSSFAGDAEPGDVVAFTAALQAPPSARFPGAYNFARRAWFEQIGGTGFSYGHLKPLPAPAVAPEWSRLKLTQLRRALTLRIRGGLDGQKGAIAAALVTGDRSTISDETAESLRIAGLAHMLAISGLHMGLVAGLVFAGGAVVLASIPAIGRRFDARKPAALLGLAAAIAYLLLSGGSAATQRAFVMVVVVFIAILFNRRALSVRTISLAAFVVVVLAPENVISPGFQMSFSAALALIAFYEWAGARVRPLPFVNGITIANLLSRAFMILLALALTSLIAGFATGPAAAFYFNRSASYGLVANLAAMPVFTFIVMPSLLIGTVLESVGGGGPFFTIAGWGLAVILQVAQGVSQFPKAVFYLPSISPVIYALFIVGLLLLCLLRDKRRIAGAALIAVGILFWSTVKVPDGLLVPAGGVLALDVNGDKMLLGYGVFSRFELDQFTAASGLAPDHGVELKKAKALLPCDHRGCLAKLADGRRVAMVLSAEQLAEDCRFADIVVLTHKVSTRNHANCPNGKILNNHADEAGALLYFANKTQIKNLPKPTRPWSNSKGGN